MPRARKYPEGELLERAARLVLESGAASQAQRPGLAQHAQSGAGKYVRHVEAKGRRKDVLSSHEREEIKTLRREVAQLRRANEISEGRQCVFAGELDSHRPK